MEKLSMEALNRKSVDEFKEAEKFPVIAVLENIRSAYNVGSVFRSADAFLLSGIYLIGYCPLPGHKEIKKTALGAEESVSWQHFDTAEKAINSLKENGYKVFAIEQVLGSISLQAISFTPEEKVALIFGNEVTGVEQKTIELCDGCIEIPQVGMKHSINIANAAAIVFWEFVRGKIKTI